MQLDYILFPVNNYPRLSRVVRIVGFRLCAKETFPHRLGLGSSDNQFHCVEPFLTKLISLKILLIKIKNPLGKIKRNSLPGHRVWA
jgi:hypothetical protein